MIRTITHCICCAMTLACKALCALPLLAQSPPEDGEAGFLVGASEQQRRAYQLVEEARKVAETDPMGACERYVLALSIDPDDSIVTREAHRPDMRFRTYRDLARVQVNLGKPSDAVETYGRLVVRLPAPDGAVWEGIARAWEATGDHVRALAFYWQAAEAGYESAGRDPRRFLYEAIIRLVDDPASRAPEIQREVDTYGDWIAYYHRAESSRPRERDTIEEVVVRLEAVVCALQTGTEVLDRSRVLNGQSDLENRTWLQGELDAARAQLREALQELQGPSDQK